MIDPTLPLPLLGGLTPAEFMQRHWQKQHLLIRGAIPDFKPPISFAGIKKLARDDSVQARMIWQEGDQWQMEHGPFSRLPTPKDTHWSVLVQGADLHDDAAAALMHQFRFIPDARLDDMMISIAGDGGGVGPHFDSYDVFLLQAQGQRKWRIGVQNDLSLEPDLPLKILRNFVPQEEHVLEPGDMLYLPPQVAHDGIALGECMTISIGFKSPTLAVLAQGMLDAAADQIMARAGASAGPYAEPPLPAPDLSALYHDPDQIAVSAPAAIPPQMIEAALQAVSQITFDESLAIRFLGCWLTEPHASVQFDFPEDGLDLFEDVPAQGTLILDRRTRLLYRDQAVFINGETVALSLTPALQALADRRQLALDADDADDLTDDERSLLMDWYEAGWIRFQARQKKPNRRQA